MRKSRSVVKGRRRESGCVPSLPTAGVWGKETAEKVQVSQELPVWFWKEGA